MSAQNFMTTNRTVVEIFGCWDEVLGGSTVRLVRTREEIHRPDLSAAAASLQFNLRRNKDFSSRTTNLNHFQQTPQMWFVEHRPRCCAEKQVTWFDSLTPNMLQQIVLTVS